MNAHGQAWVWQKPSPLDDENEGHEGHETDDGKNRKINREAGTAKGDEKSKTFEEGWGSHQHAHCSGMAFLFQD